MKLIFIGKLRDPDLGILRKTNHTRNPWIIEASKEDSKELIESGLWKKYMGKKSASQTWSTD